MLCLFDRAMAISKEKLSIVILRRNLSKENRQAKEIEEVFAKTKNRNKESFEARNNLLLFTSLASLFLILIIFPITVKCFFIDQKQSPQLHEWSYQDQTDWRKENKQCGLRNQSPIDIQRRYVIPSGHLKLQFYNYNQYIKFKIQNAHHTIKLNPIDLSANDQFGIKLNQNQQLGESMASKMSGASVTEITATEDDIEPEYEAKAPVNNNKHNDHHNNHQGQVYREPTRITADHRHHSLENKSHQFSSYNNNHNNQQQQNQGLDSNSIGIMDENVVDLAESSTSSPTTSLPYNGAPTIKLDWLDDGNNEYKLHDIHFHWGERRDNGSEHAIDGRRAAMEMHLVHIKHGLDKAKIGYTSDSITVIAVLIESYRKSNADFNPIVNALTRINMTSQTQDIEYKSINDLLPNILTSFYTYSGSLTTPPCYQVVNWIIMSDRLYLNAKQIEMFRNLYVPTHGENERPEGEQGSSSENSPPIMPNIRHIQPLNNRTILASFSPLSRLEQIQVANSPYNASEGNTSNVHLTYLTISIIWSISLLCLAVNNKPLRFS